MRLLVTDDDRAAELIQERKRRGLDRHDEVWEGMYVMPSMPNLDHQKLVLRFSTILDGLIVQQGKGQVYPGANVSDRRKNWKDNYRVPDVIVALKGGRASHCGPYLFGGPDFLIEIESPGDDTEEKVPFYSKINVRELLILHRDKRTLRLLRHDGHELVLVVPSLFEGKRWLVSEVLPLAFRRKLAASQPLTEVRRTEGEPGLWTM